MSSIVWLASYPKSGNTWIRVLLTNYLNDSRIPADINRLIGGPAAANRHVFDEMVGVEASDLTPDEVQSCRPTLYRLRAGSRQATQFIKVHDAFTRAPSGESLFPTDPDARAVYMVRNPLDVVVSLSHHRHQPIDTVISDMCAWRAASSARDSFVGLWIPEVLLTWGDHVRSWTTQTDIPVTVVKYEDLISEPLESFERVLCTSGIEIDASRLRRAVTHSRFDELRAQEMLNGFVERAPRASAFFRSGLAGQWRSILSQTQVQTLLDANGDVMRSLGYLDGNGLPM